ncbi:flagellar hook-associated protein 3 FlgL [Homoserinimonas aerilata]|uniref:Flagellar hook-associated protein 3 FlgL n=1 Tax=Homoserinimonas aerilata TaxID=1162970 RepID=A0A542YEW5_9MICO|nr:flagellar hook-associated protein FlgL [Homoserinimonas aerilata]TQL46600.1 flagellar hook-associated protein 3 FlgL [Homoserinimonas aerilata]
MITRTTSNLLMRNAQQNLDLNKAALGRLQDQASSLKKIGKPSDDPTGTASSLQVRAAQRATEQYSRNISDGDGWLSTVDSTLMGVDSLLNRVRDLTVRGANDGSMSPTAKEAIAVELEGLSSELLTRANSQYLGRSIFAGSSDAGVAFNPDYSYTGAAGATVERRIDAVTTVRVDASGDEVFGTGATSVFALVDNIVADLRSGTNVSTRIGELDTRLEAVRGAQATIGARHSQILNAKETNVNQTVALEIQRSDVEDLDLAKALIDLQVQELTYQSTLSVTARVLQPTLMDFLR